MLTAILLGAADFGRAAERVISLGGDVTEIVYGLGEGDAVVAVDLTSTYPEAAAKLPRVGYVRRLSAEGILALEPKLVIATADAGPPEVLDQLESAGVKVVRLPEPEGLASIREKIRLVADALGEQEKGAELIAKFDADYAAAQKVLESEGEIDAVYVMARPDGALSVAGQGTAADTVLNEAGLRNATADHTGYKPVNAEALLAIDPDVIVTGTRTVEGAGGMEQFKANPAVSTTSAAQNDRILVFDEMYLLGLGPRAAQAVKELAESARR
ncbi:MAG: ABC transporter substrate-binding protein [Pirellulaceae bacterium]|nr:ABC transporter substrate-binding protein [Pirellulaceae bacterium]